MSLATAVAAGPRGALMTACAAWIPRMALVVLSIATAPEVAAEPCKNHYILEGEPPCELVLISMSLLMLTIAPASTVAASLGARVRRASA